MNAGKHTFTIDDVQYERTYRTRYGSDRLLEAPKGPLYKVVSTNLGAAHGGFGQWVPGEWWIVGDGKHDTATRHEQNEIEACRNGLHLTNEANLGQWLRSECRLFEVEVAGPVISADGGDKFIVAAARPIREIPVDEALMTLLGRAKKGYDWQAQARKESQVGSRLILELFRKRLDEAMKKSDDPRLKELAEAAAKATPSTDGRLPVSVRNILMKMEAYRKLLGSQSQYITAQITYNATTGNGFDALIAQRVALGKEREAERLLLRLIGLSSSTTYSEWMGNRGWERSRSLRRDFGTIVSMEILADQKKVEKVMNLTAALARTKGETKQKRGV